MTVSYYSMFLVPCVPFLCSIGSMFKDHVVESPISAYHTVSFLIPNPPTHCIVVYVYISRISMVGSVWSDPTGISGDN
jgi:hypothetical protein